MRIKEVILFLILTPVILGSVRSFKYSTLSDQSFYTYDTIDDITIYQPQNTTFTSEFIERESDIILAYLKVFAKKNKLPLDRCKDSELLIFVVNMDIINDLDRYPYTTNKVPQRWGLYDPYPKDQELSAILLTDHEDIRIDQVLLGHEMAHYWFDEFCWGNSWNGSTEQFALAYQDFYTIERFGRRY